MIETILYATADVRVGTFRCPLSYPGFRTAGPIEGYTVAFPRSAVWIQHDGQAPFVADPLVVTIYNKGQPYVRMPLSPEGDRVDWFSVSQPLAASVAADIDCRSEDPERPFRAAYANSSSSLYRRQRLLLHRIARHGLGGLALEEEVVMLLASVLERSGLTPVPPRTVRTSAQRALVEAARAELARDVTSALSLRALAARLNASPYHLCRVFRRWTGRTLQSHRLDLRVWMALEGLAEADPDLSRLAHRLGFSSHSHFTETFRRRMGATPSRLRAALLPPLRAIG